MRQPIPPLEIAKSLGVLQTDIAARLGVSLAWLRHLAKDPRHKRRVLVAELEAVLEQQRLELSLEGLMRSRP